MKAVSRQLIKTLQLTHYGNITEEIEEARRQFDMVQSQIHRDQFNPILHNQEQQHLDSLRKWLQIEESILTQKSRIHWLQAGDSNSKVFFAAMKERHARNSIDVLYSSTGTRLEHAADIQEDLICFYSNLMGKCNRVRVT